METKDLENWPQLCKVIHETNNNTFKTALSQKIRFIWNLLKQRIKRKKQHKNGRENKWLRKNTPFTCFNFFFFYLLESLASVMTSSNKAARGSWEPYALWYSNSSGLIWRQNDGADKVISMSAPGYFIWGKWIISESTFSNKLQKLIQIVQRIS